MSTSQRFSVNQKGLAPILIVLIVAALVGGYLIYTNYSNNRIKTVSQHQVSTSQTPQPIPQASSSAETSNWKTYTNSQDKYMFNNPSNWKLKEEPIAKGESRTVFLYTGSTVLDKDYQVVIIHVNDNSDNLSIEDYVKKYRGDLGYSYTNLVVDNLPAKETALVGECDNNDTGIFIKKAIKIYEIIWGGCRGKKVNRDIFNEFLSTFKFLP